MATEDDSAVTMADLGWIFYIVARDEKAARAVLTALHEYQRVAVEAELGGQDGD